MSNEKPSSAPWKALKLTGTAVAVFVAVIVVGLILIVVGMILNPF